MTVRLSASARAYLQREATYLRSHSQSAANNFLKRMKAAREDLEDFKQSGFEGDDLPLPGMRRLVRGGYWIDYKVENGDVLIAAISSSVNTPLDRPSDDPDFDFETNGEG